MDEDELVDFSESEEFFLLLDRDEDGTKSLLEEEEDESGIDLLLSEGCSSPAPKVGDRMFSIENFNLACC